MKYALIIYVIIFSGCQIVESSKVPLRESLPQDPIERSAYHIQNNEARKALKDLEVLAVSNPSAEIYYMTGRAYAAIGELDNAVIYYQKALQLQSDYHNAYTLLKEIHRYRQITLQEEIDSLKEKQVSFSQTGKDDIEKIMYDLNQAYNEQTQIYLAQGKAFLLYHNPSLNISDFPELEAQLRDVQDFIRERKQTYVSSQINKKFTDPIYLSLLNMRSDVTKKHIKNLVLQSATERDNNNIVKSIDLLKEANTQVGRYYESEDSNIESLVRDDEIQSLSRQINQELITTYQKSVEIYLANRKEYEKLQQWQEVLEQNRKIEENIENLLQVQIVNLLRFENVSIQEAQHHETLIPFYLQLISFLPDSDKKGEYHLQLAYCYAQKGNYANARKYALLAKDSVGEYRVNDFLARIKEK